MTNAAMSPAAAGRPGGRGAVPELLALCPLLVAATSLIQGAVLSLVFLFVFCMAAVSASACRRLVPPEAETACLLILAAAWVSIADLVLQAAAFPLREALGIYVPIMAGNWLLLVHLGESALTRRPGRALAAAFGVGIRVALLVTAAAALRELAATGALLEDAPWLPGRHDAPITLPIFAAAPGAFLALALLVAAVHRLRPEGLE
jgi:electron transport complex protein RnfE